MTAPTTSAIDLTSGTATKDDAQLMLQLAQLMVQLAQLGTTPAMDRGMAILFTTAAPMTYAEFSRIYSKGSADHQAVLAVLRWYETVGTLVKNGLFDRALCYDWLYVAGVWDRCAGIATGQREEIGVAAMWENFEALAEGQRT
jgi:hypothetical protein